ncbi:MAG: anthranilate phosphoribosyltransferase, partial [Bacteroidota bacterium]
MKEILHKLFDHHSLDQEEAREVLVRISRGEFNHVQVAAFITVYQMRPVSVDELQGFRDALLELCVPVDIEGLKTLDIVGTGGDGKNTFN